MKITVPKNCDVIEFIPISTVFLVVGIRILLYDRKKVSKIKFHRAVLLCVLKLISFIFKSFNF